jgi:hypothetical protein
MLCKITTIMLTWKQLSSFFQGNNGNLRGFSINPGK